MTGTRPLDAREQGRGEKEKLHPRRRRRMEMLAVGGAVAAAALAASLTAALRAAPAVPSPLSAVTSALARTSAGSYAFSIETTVRLRGAEPRSDLASGAYDPSRHLGRELVTAHAAGQVKRAQIRFIGAYLYTSVPPGSGFGRPWDKSPLAAATAAGMPPDDPYGFASDQVVSPSGLIAVLRSAGTAVRDSGLASGPGWTGISYTFTAHLDDGQVTISGTVDVDQQGRTRRMTITTDEGGQAPGKPVLTTDRDITFGDFGAPVPVTPPPASQVEYTTGRPFRGFYF